MTRRAVLCGLVLFAACGNTYAAERIDARARRVHESLLTLDTHIDTPMLFGVVGWDFRRRHDARVDGTQLDYPRMVQGGLDAGFFATYIPQGPLTDVGRAAARDAALLRLQEIHDLVAANPAQLQIALTADDARRIVAARKRAVFLSMENGYPIGRDLTLLKAFHALGVRIIGPVHFLNNDLGDSSTDPAGPTWHGLSPLGRDYVREANRLGLLLDASHASDEVLDQMLELSAAPIILTHSGAKAVFDHPRNVDDDRLRRIAAKGGVIQVYAYGDYFVAKARQPDRDAAIATVRRSAGASRSRAAIEARTRELAAIDARYPTTHATFEDFMAHLLHVIRVAGVEHAGIGLDFDGGGGVDGLRDASDYPRITARLLREGLSPAEIAKVWSGNALRVLTEAQARAERVE